ncbi:MAG TPA: phage BR0599 family protein [bacterium]|nr:phage BR0599 family protein [bacterium]
MGRIVTPEVTEDLERTFSAPVSFMEIWLDPDDSNPDAEPDYRFVNHGRDLQLEGITYTAHGFVLSSIDQTVSKAYPDQIQLGFVNVPGMTSPIDLEGLAARGRLDGARVRIRDISLYHIDSSLHSRTRVDAFVDGISFEERGALVNLSSQSLIRRTELPKRMMEPTCGWKMYGEGCGVVRATYAVSITAGPGSTPYRIIDTTTLVSESLANGADHFAMGYVEIASGDYKGKSAPILRFHTTDRALILQIPLDVPAAEIVGLSLTAIPGCRLTAQDCETRYDNLLNFGGFHTAPREPHLETPGDYR